MREHIKKVREELLREFPELHTKTGQVTRKWSKEVAEFRKLQVERIHGGTIHLLDDFTKMTHRYAFSCRECGHRWTTKLTQVVNTGTGCAKCAGNLKKTKEDIIKELQGREVLLIGPYLGADALTQWECTRGHQWDAKPSSILSGKGCLKCSGKERLSNAVVDARLEEGGRTIHRIGEYKNSRTKILWACEKGHTWDAKPDHVLNTGRGCPTCALHHDCLYLWQVAGTDSYKIGISRKDIVGARASQVARGLNTKPENLQVFEVHDPAAVERHLLSTYTTNPYVDYHFDGHTEFRTLTQKDLDDILAYLRGLL